MKECARCGRGLSQRRQATLCADCRDAINLAEAKKSAGKQYTAFELGVALLSLPKADRQLPVIVGSQFDGPAQLLIIEVCRPGNEAPYVWVGDPDV